MEPKRQRPLLKCEARHYVWDIINRADYHKKMRKDWLAAKRSTPEGLLWHRAVMARAMRKYRAKLKAQQENTDGSEKDGHSAGK